LNSAVVVDNQRRWDGSLGSGEAGLKEMWF